jgi:hypothetical protein
MTPTVRCCGCINHCAQHIMLHGALQVTSEG